MNKAVRNERRKLMATFINGLAIAVFAIGGFTPMLGVAQSAQISLRASVLIIGCILTGGALHWVARSLLGGMEE